MPKFKNNKFTLDSNFNYTNVKNYIKNIFFIQKNCILNYSEKVNTSKLIFINSCKNDLKSEVKKIFFYLNLYKKIKKLNINNLLDFEKLYIKELKKNKIKISINDFYSKNIKNYITKKLLSPLNKSSFLSNKNLVKIKVKFENLFKVETINKIQYYINLGLRTEKNINYLTNFCNFLKNYSEPSFYTTNTQIELIQDIFKKNFEQNLQQYNFFKEFQDKLKTNKLKEFCKNINDKKFILLLFMYIDPFKFSIIISELLSISLNKVFFETVYFNKVYLISYYLEEVIAIIVNGIKVGQLNKIYDIVFKLKINLNEKDKELFIDAIKNKNWQDIFKQYNIDINELLNEEYLTIPISVKHLKIVQKTNNTHYITFKRMPVMLDLPLQYTNFQTIPNFKVWLLNVLILDKKIQMSLENAIDYFNKNTKNNSLLTFFTELKKYLKINQNDFKKLIIYTFIAYLKTQVMFNNIIPSIIVGYYSSNNSFIVIPININKYYNLRFRSFVSKNLKEELYNYLIKHEKIPPFILFDSSFKDCIRLEEGTLKVYKGEILNCSSNIFKEISYFPKIVKTFPSEFNTKNI